MRTFRSLQRRWTRVGPWLIPAAYSVAALAAGTLLPRLERWLAPGGISEIDSGAAIAVFSAIASGMITLTGLVFSLTFVMVQFSATAYSPRLVLWLARDPLISHATGIFSATFLYAIAALFWVNRSGVAGVPWTSGALVVVLLLASVAVFLGLVHRVALLQIHRVLGFLAEEGRRVIDSVYPATTEDAPPEPAPPGSAAARQEVVHRGAPQAVQAIEVDSLARAATAAGAVIEVATAVGDTVFDGTTLLRVCGAPADLDEDVLRAAVDLGEERTFEQDPKYALRLLVDIAIRALSPAVNDPTTAVQALDQIGDLLLRLGRRRLEAFTVRDADGVARVRLRMPAWDEFLRLAFEEIRAYGGSSVQVMRRLQALIADLIALLPSERRGALERWQARLRATVHSAFASQEEREEASIADRQGIGSPTQSAPEPK